MIGKEPQVREMSIEITDDVIERIMPTPATESESRRKNAADWARYDFAAQFVAGKRVIDCACGAGYGSHLLARSGATSVVGLDISEDAIGWASRHFAAPALRFQRVSGALPVDDASTDVVVSFETIEHVAPATVAQFVSELARVLVDGGTLVLSTPLTPGNERFHPPNPFHLREYTEDELTQLLAPHFTIERRLGQHSRASANFGSLKRMPGIGHMLRSGLHRVVPVTLRSWARRALLGSQIGDGPSAWVSEVRWREAPVQLVVARKRADHPAGP
jgi:SAM-dependent methyltransferase